MRKDHRLDRREFTVQSALAMLSGVVITITDCGGGSKSPTAPATPSANKSGVITNNHGHFATITSAQLTAGGALSLSIQGNADHTHTLELSAAEVMQIAGGQRVSKETSFNVSPAIGDHNHTATFN